MCLHIWWQNQRWRRCDCEVNIGIDRGRSTKTENHMCVLCVWFQSIDASSWVCGDWLKIVHKTTTKQRLLSKWLDSKRCVSFTGLKRSKNKRCLLNALFLINCGNRRSFYDWEFILIPLCKCDQIYNSQLSWSDKQCYSHQTKRISAKSGK